MMTKTTTFLLAAALVAPALGAIPAVAADLMAAPAAAAPAAPAAASTTLGFEISPEFIAAPNADPNDITDGYVKGTITEAVAPGWSISGIGQYTLKGLKPGSASQTWQGQVEVNAAYKAKLNDDFSVTVTGGLGYAFGNTGYNAANLPSGAGTQPFFYWYGQAAFDYKLDSHWTLNLVSVRARDSFTVAWWTPKIQTGVTYNIDATDAVYGNVGYAWKDNTGGYAFTPDKWNTAVGYKHSF